MSDRIPASKTRESHVSKSAEAQKPAKKKTVIIMIGAIVLLVASVFMALSALNAFRVYKGDSVWGLGRLFFETSVVNGSLKPMIVCLVVSLISVLFSITVILICLLKIILSSDKR